MSDLTISQTLKKKSRLLKEYKDILSLIIRENSKPNDNPRFYNITDLLKQAESKMEELVNLKTSIHKASEPMRDKIFRMSELKSFLGQFNSLDVFQGKRADGYHNTERLEYNVHINQVEKDK